MNAATIANPSLAGHPYRQSG